MSATFAVRKIEGLAGAGMPDRSDEFNIVAHIMDCVLECESCNGSGAFADWTPDLAIDTYPSDTWFLEHGLYPADINWDVVTATIDEMLCMLRALDAVPTGVVLICKDDGQVWAATGNLAAAKANTEKRSNAPQSWKEILDVEDAIVLCDSGAVCKFVEIGLPSWIAGSVERLSVLGRIAAGYCSCRDAVLAEETT